MIVVVPVLKADTTPAVETVAISGLDEAQGVVACGVAVPVRVDVLPMQALSVPVMEGKELTVTFIAGEVAEQPKLLVTVRV